MVSYAYECICEYFTKFVSNVTHVIPTGNKDSVTGVTSPNDQLFVVRYSAQQRIIEVYDSTPSHHKGIFLFLVSIGRMDLL